MHISKKQTWGIRLLPLVTLLGSILLSVPAEGSTPQIGGGTCSNLTLSGTYYYLVNGDVLSNGQRVSAALLGKFVADGVGHITGSTIASVNGKQSTGASFTDRFSVQSNCSGVFIESSDNITFQVVNNGVELVMAVSTSDGVLLGTGYRQTLGTSPIQCGNGSLSGAYGYQLVGDYGGSPYADAGQFVADGNGNINTTSVANVGNTSPVTSSGTYTVGNDCSGTAQVSNQNGTVNYQFAVVEDGKGALFFCTTAGWTVAGVFTPQFAPPQNSVVNGASFRSQMVSPGSLFSIFGTGLSAQPASAGTVPLPNSLGGTQVLVNGTPAPLLYVGDNQVNAQMPIDVSPGQAVTFTVTNGGTASNSVIMTVPAAAPGFFTLDGKEAIVQNPNGSMNTAANPAHPGDVLVVYLTGGGAVNASGPWITGADSPQGASSVKAPYSLTIGGQPADVQYVGLAPGFVGLYQANFKLPSLTAGSYPMVLTIGGISSNAASVAVGD
jgi:uncharacterized protein (TIGR03437 family)